MCFSYIESRLTYIHTTATATIAVECYSSKVNDLIERQEYIEVRLLWV